MPWSCQAGLRCPPSQTVSMPAIARGSGPAPMGCISFPLVCRMCPREALQEMEMGCVCLREPVRIKGGLSALQTIPSVTSRKTRSSEFHNPCARRAGPQRHQAGLAGEESREKESPLHSPHRESRLMVRSRKVPAVKPVLKSNSCRGSYRSINDIKKTACWRVWRKGNPQMLLVGMQMVQPLWKMVGRFHQKN